MFVIEVHLDYLESKSKFWKHSPAIKKQPQLWVTTLGHCLESPHSPSFPSQSRRLSEIYWQFMNYWRSGSNNAVACRHVLPLDVSQNSIFIHKSRPRVSFISFPISPKCLLCITTLSLNTQTWELLGKVFVWKYMRVSDWAGPWKDLIMRGLVHTLRTNLQFSMNTTEWLGRINLGKGWATDHTPFLP